jgi:hypothetical protein
MEEFQRVVADGHNDYWHYQPVPAGTEFRVEKFFKIEGDTGGEYVDAIVLNGPMAGSRVNPMAFFVRDDEIGGPPNGQFVIGSGVIPVVPSP